MKRQESHMEVQVQKPWRQKVAQREEAKTRGAESEGGVREGL